MCNWNFIILAVFRLLSAINITYFSGEIHKARDMFGLNMKVPPREGCGGDGSVALIATSF